MSARSIVLVAYRHNDNALHTVYTCPGAKTVIIKSILYVNASGSATSFYVNVGRGSNFAYLFKTASLANDSPQMWQGWVVLQPNDVIQAQSGAAAVLWWASGSLLDGVAT